jgi:hypothetical protein
MRDGQSDVRSAAGVLINDGPNASGLIRSDEISSAITGVIRKNMSIRSLGAML